MTHTDHRRTHQQQQRGSFRRRLFLEPLESRCYLSATVFEPSPTDGTAGIQRDIDRASDGDVILLSGVYRGAGINVGKDLDFYGEPGAAIDVARAGVAVTLENAVSTLYGFSIRGGKGVIGGNIKSTGSRVFLDTMTVSGGCATVAGAGAAFHSSVVTITNSLFTENSQVHADCGRSFAGVGPAILAADGTILDLAASEIFGNDAWSSGAVHTAGIYAGPHEVAGPAASVTIHNTAFHDNDADGHVDIVTGNNQNVTLTNNTFFDGGRGVFDNAAVAVFGGSDAGTAEVRNNTIHGYENGLLVSDNATAIVSNNIFSQNETALTAGINSTSKYNLFDINGQNYDGGIEPGAGDQEGDAAYENPVEGKFNVGEGVPLGDPSPNARNWDGSVNIRGFQGGTPQASIQPNEISTNLQRLAAWAFVSAQSPATERPAPYPAPIVDTLDFNQVNSITAIPLADAGGNYIVARPRAGIDNFPLPVFTHDPTSARFRERTYEEAEVGYAAVGIEADELPPSAKYFSRINFGDFDPVTGGYPLYYTIGGDDGYGRANAQGQVPGPSDRITGVQDAFSQNEDFPYLTAAFVMTNPEGGATMLARFESQHTTGAIKLDIKGGRPTVVDAEGFYFTRDIIAAGSNWGFKGLSSMHWRRPAETPEVPNDSAFDTQFVHVVFADGSSVLHELRNPEVLDQLDTFDLGAGTDADVEQFSLVQLTRTRESFDKYDAAHYDLRPTVITTIIDQSVPTTTKVLHAQGSSEYLDNLVVLQSPRNDIPATTAYGDAVHIKTRSLYGEIEQSINMPPTISALANQTIYVDETTGPIVLTIADDFIPSDQLGVVVTSTSPSLVTVDDMRLGGTGGERTLTIAPSQGAIGSATIEVAVTDQFGEVAKTSFELAIVNAPTTASFELLADVTQDERISEAYGVSSNGLVVGYSENKDRATAVKWTHGGPLTLEDLPGGGNNSGALDIADDGATVVGFGRTASTVVGGEGTFWPGGTMPVAIAPFAGVSSSGHAFAVSADGTTTGGSSSYTGSATDWEGYIYRQDTGVVRIGRLEGDQSSAIYAVSENGSAAVGWSGTIVRTNGAPPPHNEAIYWTAEAGIQPLGDLSTGEFNSRANAIAQTGEIVGFASTDAGRVATIWDSKDAAPRLLFESPSGVSDSIALAISDDAAVVVGEWTTAGGKEAWIWRDGAGVQSLERYLQTFYDLDLQDRRLETARDVSGNVRYITGTARDTDGNGEAYLITLPDRPVASEPLVRIGTEVLTLDYVPTESVNLGDQFLIQVTATDLRTDPLGVFSAYVDLALDGELASLADSITIGTEFPNANSGTITLNRAEEVGGMRDLHSHSQTAVLFTLPATAVAEGLLAITTDPADVIPEHEILLLERNHALPPVLIEFGSAMLRIVSNTPPIAYGDAFEVDEDLPLVISASLGVLANDDDTDGDVLTSELVRGPQVGALRLGLDGSFTYEAPQDYHGDVDFIYRAHDGREFSEEVVATIRIRPVNDAPIVVEDQYEVPENGRLDISAAAGVLANDRDAESSPLNAVLATQPTHGSLMLHQDGSFAYIPNTGFAGDDQFSYRGSDGDLTSAPTSVDINVLPLLARVRLEVTDLEGKPTDRVAVGSEFLLSGHGVDLRQSPGGVASLFTDIAFDSQLAVARQVEYATEFDANRAGAISSGRIDEVGAGQGSTNIPQTAEVLVFTVRMEALAAGQAEFVADAADVLPAHAIQLGDLAGAIDALRVEYCSAMVSIVTPSWSNPDNRFDVNGDGAVSPVDALLGINELNRAGAGRLEAAAATLSPPYYDVNTDGYLSPLDVLLVVNLLNLFSSGEAESVEATAASLRYSQLVVANASDNPLVAANGRAEIRADAGPRQHAAGDTATGPAMPIGRPPRDTASLIAKRSPNEQASLFEFLELDLDLDDVLTEISADIASVHFSEPNA